MRMRGSAGGRGKGRRRDRGSRRGLGAVRFLVMLRGLLLSGLLLHWGHYRVSACSKNSIDRKLRLRRRFIPLQLGRKRTSTGTNRKDLRTEKEGRTPDARAGGQSECCGTGEKSVQSWLYSLLGQGRARLTCVDGAGFVSRFVDLVYPFPAKNSPNGANLSRRRAEAIAVSNFGCRVGSSRCVVLPKGS